MIKIQRTDKPAQLTAEKQKELTEEYKADSSKSVWRQPYIVDNLYAMSHGKCCYCESKLGEESKDMQVEHFHPKSLFPNEVVDWQNLLPCCSRCNSNKGNHDTVASPIINPTIQDPRDYFYIVNFRYRSDDPLGKNTIDVLYLNNTTKLVYPRIRICQTALEKLENINAETDILKSNLTTRRKNKVVNGVKDLLRLAQPDQTFSAIMASTILNSPDYPQIKQKLLGMNLWDDEVIELEQTSKTIALRVQKFNK